jgi:hypothetical protein
MNVKEIQNLLKQALKSKLKGVKFEIANGYLYIGKDFKISIVAACDEISLRDPNVINSTVDNFSEDLVTMYRFAGDPSLLDKRILPRILPSVKAEKLPSVPKIEWLPGLFIVIMIDYEYSSLSLDSDNLNNWNISLEDAYELSLCNLYERFLECHDQLRPTGGVLIDVLAPNGYVSSCILLDEVKNLVAKQLNGYPYYGILPDRDHLTFFNSFDKDLAKIGKVCKDAKSSPYSISPDIFTVTKDGVLIHSEETDS